MNRMPPFLKWLASSVLALAVFTGIFFLRGQSSTTVAVPTKSPSANAIRSLLVLLTDDDSKVTRTSLVVAAKDFQSATALSFDPRIVIDMGDSGMMPIREAIPTADPSGVDSALSMASGVQIDGALLVQRLALAGLIDAVGGVTINSPDTYRVSPKNEPAVYVRKGKSSVDGTRAAGYALTSDANYLEVLTKTFAKLPSDPQRINEILGALGSLARSTIPTGDISSLLVSMVESDVFTKISTIDVPTASSSLELAAKSDWRRISLGWSSGEFGLRAKGESLRIAIRSDIPLDRLRARDAIRRTGMMFIDGGSAKPIKTTQLVVANQPTKKFAEQIAEALDLKAIKVIVDPTVTTVDAVIVLGVDYR